MLKGRLGGRFGRTMKSQERAGAEFCIFFQADYPHVKHRKCRERSLAVVVGCWPKPNALGLEADPAIVSLVGECKVLLPPTFRVRVRSDNSI